jgi:hypothetical protein
MELPAIRAAGATIASRVNVPDRIGVGKGMLANWTSALSALAVLLMVASARPVSAVALTFPPTTFTILNPDTGAAIGRSTYRVDSAGDRATLHGEYGYFDGQTDVEIAHLDLGAPGQPPRLVDFDHTFYDANRSIVRRHHLDVKSGAASCIDNSGGQKSEQDDVLSVPDNTWAGASVVIPVQEFLRANEQEMTLPLNVFNCATSPKIFAVNVTKDSGIAIWAPYGGDALRVEVQPDFGWLNVIIAAFVPKLHAWFDPHDGWAFLGDQAARFYKGPPIILVKSPSNAAADGGHSAK